MFVYMIKAIDEVPNATPKYLVYNPEERGENVFELSSNTMRAFKCINLGMVNNFLYDAHQAFPTEYFEIVTKTSEELGEIIPQTVYERRVPKDDNYQVVVLGDSESKFTIRLSDNEKQIIEQFLETMSKNVASYDMPCIEFVAP